MTTIERKAKAATALQKLKEERQTILSQQKTAQATIERMNQDIVQAQRSGDAATLTSLRVGRREAEETMRDLDRTLPTVVNDLRSAEGEVVMSERAVLAEQYNLLQVEQVQLTKTIEESNNTIAGALDEKQRLATHQQRLAAQVLPGERSQRGPDPA